MNFEEYAAKPVLAAAGIPVPDSRLVTDAEAAAEAARALGPAVVKAQVPIGGRGKAGGIRLVGSPEEAAKAAAAILKLEIGGWPVERLLIEQQCALQAEYYAAILNDAASKGPLLLFSTMGGVDIEEVAARDAGLIRRVAIPIESGLTEDAAAAAIAGLDLACDTKELVAVLVNLYKAYRANDAELLEINPLGVTEDGHVIALDCKFILDDSSVQRRADLVAQGVPERTSALEERGKAVGLRFIELDGSVGILANGAGLTMTTMDAVTHYGGRPANFLEIGGDAYTKAIPALEIVLDHPGVKSLLVNFCGAFARTDVMTEGVVKALQTVKPDVPVFFSIHGTGEVEAIKMVREELGLEPCATMDEAVQLAVEAAQ